MCCESEKLKFFTFAVYVLSRSTDCLHASEETPRGLPGMNAVCVLFVQPYGNVQILFWGFFAEMQSEIIQHIL